MGQPETPRASRPSAGGEHLLVVATNLLESEGGVQSHLRALTPRLVERGVRTTIVSLGDTAQREPRVHDLAGVRVLELPRRVDLKGVIGLPDPRTWRRLEREILTARGSAPDLVATHTRFFPMSALGLRIARRLGVPLLHTEHGAGSVVTGSPLIEAASRVVDLSMGRHVLRGADEVLAVSRRTSDFVADLAGVGSRVVPNGIDVDAWLPRAGAVASSPRRLVFVGRLVAEKGWREFLDVAHRLGEAGADVQPHVVGDGADAAEARAYAAGRGLDVAWHGALRPGEIRDLLTGAVYVNPSRAAEGFQLTQLEAAVAGAFVVTFDVGVAQDLALAHPGRVTVVPVGDVPGLASGALAALGSRPAPPTHDEMLRWDWGTVADEQVSIMRGLASRAPRR